MNNLTSEQLLILVIEDKQELLDELSSVLCDANYATCSCTTPEDALAAARETPPALVISDTSLHGESGLEICESIRQQPGLDSVPVMFLSSGQLTDVIRRHDTLGGTYYLRKPIDRSVLIGLIDRVLQVPSMVGS